MYHYLMHPSVMHPSMVMHPGLMHPSGEGEGSSETDTQVLHTTIHHQCAACGQLFLPGETLVALVYRNSVLEIHKNIIFSSIGKPCEQKTAEDLHLMFCQRQDCESCMSMRQMPFLIPRPEQFVWHLRETPEVHNIFCKSPLCHACRTAEESVSIHTDCFELFEQHCTIGNDNNSSEQNDEKYRRLWLAGTRQYAWREMEPLKFSNSSTLAVRPAEMISKICGFQETFLPEVIRLIQSYLQSHIIWRYCSAIELAQELGSANAEEAAVTYKVPKVLSWSRGSTPQLVQDESLAGSFIRFTIDHRGISSIDRFSDTEPITTGKMPASSYVFVVEPIERLSDAKIEFELGLGRLHIPADLHISTWSTPNPLQLMSLIPHPYPRLAAISLDPEHCTGISFFLTTRVVREIHAHSGRRSNHLERFKYLRAMFDHEIAWIYVPLTAQDKITAMEIRQNVTTDRPHHFTIWTKTGKIIVGTPQRATNSSRTRANNTPRRPGRGILYEMEEDSRRPLNLIHEIPSSGLMKFIGTDADKQTETTEVDVDPHHVWPLAYAFFSSASLEGVSSVRVFSDKRRSLCKGILFEYENGSKRAVGQCRLGWDHVHYWRKPLSMFYGSATYQFTDPNTPYHTIRHKSVQVRFDSESDHVAEDGTRDENYYPMKGYLNFWFRINDVEIEIVNPS